MRELPACFTVCRIGKVFFAVSPSERTSMRTFERQVIDIASLRVVEAPPIAPHEAVLAS